SSVNKDNSPRDRKPQAKPSVPACPAAINLVKPFEDFLEPLGRDTDSGIADANLDTSLNPRHHDAHAPAGGIELDGIGDELGEQRREVLGIGHDLEYLAPKIQVQSNVALRGSGLMVAHDGR